MDDARFDALSRLLGQGASRRALLAILGGTIVAGAGEARAKRQHGGKHQGKGRNRRTAKESASACYPGTRCSLGRGQHDANCDFSHRDLTGRDFGGSYFRGSSFAGSNLTRANLGGATLSNVCFADADLTGATLTGANTSGAIFCNTTMPDGSLNNNGCNKVTACCQHCEPECTDRACGASDGCGGTCQTGTCPTCQTCSNGACTNEPDGAVCIHENGGFSDAEGKCSNGACICFASGETPCDCGFHDLKRCCSLCCFCPGAGNPQGSCC